MCCSHLAHGTWSPSGIQGRHLFTQLPSSSSSSRQFEQRTKQVTPLWLPPKGWQEVHWCRQTKRISLTIGEKSVGPTEVTTNSSFSLLYSTRHVFCFVCFDCESRLQVPWVVTLRTPSLAPHPVSKPAERRGNALQ